MLIYNSTNSRNTSIANEDVNMILIHDSLVVPSTSWLGSGVAVVQALLMLLPLLALQMMTKVQKH